MPAASLSPSSDGAAPADRVVRLTATLLTVYLALAVAPMMVYARAAHASGPLIVHLAALLAGVWSLASPHSAARRLRDWLPLALGPLLYIELRWLIQGVGRPHADALVQGWERLAFPGNPAETWAPRMGVPWLSELLHFCYASYYLLIYLPPVVLYARGRGDAFARTLFTLVLVYGACFVVYLAFPVDGPRYLAGPAAAPDGPVRTFVLRLLETGSSRGTAFPSSHVAASVVASLCALRFQFRIGVVVTMLTAGLALSTVYGGFHYAVDAAAGVVLGVVGWLAAMTVTRAMLRRA